MLMRNYVDRKFCFSKLSIGILISVLMFTMNIQAQYRNSTSNRPEFIPGQIIIKFRGTTKNINTETKNGIIMTGVSTLDNKFRELSVTEIKKIFPTKSSSTNSALPDISQIYQLKVSINADIKSIAAILAKDSNVEYAEPRYIYYTTEVKSVPNDSLFLKQWALTKIMAPQAWNITKGDTSVIIGILDTGVQWNHPDLHANIWHNPHWKTDTAFPNDSIGWDFVKGPLDPPPALDERVDGPGNNPMDNLGHGTHVAGIAAAVTNNKIGIAGVGWNCKILPVRVGYKGVGGGGYIVAGPEGIVYAADFGADVINMSWGAYNSSKFLYDAILYAYNKNVVLVAGAGNDNTNELFFPAAYKEVIAVAATDNNDAKASFSNFGNWVDVSAPGVNILSTVITNSYVSWMGTSMASPFVAGLAGLVKSLHKDWTNEQIRNQIIESADNIDAINPLVTGLLGKGRINAYTALTKKPSPLISVKNIQILNVFGQQKRWAKSGEKISLIVNLDNQWSNIENVSVKLTTNDYSVSLEKNTSYYGTIIGGKQVSNSNNPFIIDVSNIAHSHNVKFFLNITGTGYTYRDTFNIAIGKPTILLVDDDGEGNNVESYYTSALDSIGIAYDYWNKAKQGSPSVQILSDYKTIIWFTEWAFPTLSKDDVFNLTSYLDGGGNLFLTGEDIGWDINDPKGSAYNYGKEFYANYLHADFVEDNSNSTTILGISGDPISDGIDFSIAGGDGANNQKYPDAILPRLGATSVFKYSNGKIGGIKYQGNYRVVYLGFGFEGINSSSTRVKVMNRIITWLNEGFSIVSNPPLDTEDTTHSAIVNARVNNYQQIGTIYLYYWTNNNIDSASRIAMTYTNNDTFIAKIPPKSETYIHYFIYCENKNGFGITTPMNALVNSYSFYIGKDLVPPTIEAKFDSKTIDKIGPYKIDALVKDNIGVDSNSVFIHILKERGGENSIQMSKTNQKDKYSGFINRINIGDSIKFYITAIDVSSSKNLSKSPQHGVYAIHNVKNLIIDNFEAGTDKWELDKWGLISTNSPSPPYAITNAPSGIYKNNENNSLTLKEGLQLSSYKSAILSFWTKYQIAKGGAGIIEISSDSGLTWNKVGEEYSGLQLSWKNEHISLAQYCGRGKVYIRFRFISGSSGTGRGWYLDDVGISVDTILTTVVERSNQLIPKEFTLSQNYPNPFNPSTIISYSLPEAAIVTLRIYDVLGREVKTLVSEQQAAGTYRVNWNGDNNLGSKVASGIYIYRIVAGASYMQTKKMTLLK